MEVALLGGLPVRWSYVSFGPLIGCTYILFTWSMACHWVDVTKSGPQFIYFFMDTTLPGHLPTYGIVDFLGAFLVSFGIFSSATSILGILPGSFVAHVLFAVGVCLATMRLRDCIERKNYPQIEIRSLPLATTGSGSYRIHNSPARPIPDAERSMKHHEVYR
jgi:hypothetical protein